MKFITLTLSTFLLISMVGVYSFLFISISADVTEAGIFLEKSESLTKRDAISRSMQVFLNDNATERELIATYVAGENDVVSSIELIEDTAKGERVEISISNVTVVPQEGWNSHEGIEVTFSVSGTFSRITSFTSMLESLPIASRIKGASLEVSSDGDWFGSYSVLFVKEK